MTKTIVHFCPNERVFTSLASCFKGLEQEYNWWKDNSELLNGPKTDGERHRECSLVWVVTKPESKSDLPKEADGCF